MSRKVTAGKAQAMKRVIRKLYDLGSALETAAERVVTRMLKRQRKP